MKLQYQTRERLEAYNPICSTDQTSFLQTFLNYLPKKGFLTLMSEILPLNDGPLRVLRHHLVDILF